MLIMSIIIIIIIIIIIVNNITVLVSIIVTFFEFFMPMSHGVNKRTPPSAPTRLPIFLSPTEFSPDLFAILQKILEQPCIAVIKLFAKDNAF